MCKAKLRVYREVLQSVISASYVFIIWAWVLNVWCATDVYIYFFYPLFFFFWFPASVNTSERNSSNLPFFSVKLLSMVVWLHHISNIMVCIAGWVFRAGYFSKKQPRLEPLQAVSSVKGNLGNDTAAPSL